MIADDSVLLREGLVRLLTGEGMEVIAAVGTADELHFALARDSPDLVILDVRMPPTQTDEGVRAAQRIRREHPSVGVLLLSRAQHQSQLSSLTSRELEVLALMAEGRTNQAMSARLHVGVKTVETNVANVFGKLGLFDSADDHRRVLAVLAYLQSTETSGNS